MLHLPAFLSAHALSTSNRCARDAASHEQPTRNEQISTNAIYLQLKGIKHFVPYQIVRNLLQQRPEAQDNAPSMFPYHPLSHS